ncbi:18S rRNA (guanine-N(7))-methyltransferase RID2-like isoform X2 [Papaver somniferum]|uniref:18S rRNA (guanine-N(7))-methyltransferase RID2-like isoform X2 n=1 Tax=Papaver somniferum TaxID=3469 RepID=UPI000E6FC9DF|nr:18S rRNA (guanine-N(7))-methyltransferase RID2-like isoform X2 [Papaver somniferum]
MDGVINGDISISVVQQWICYADRSSHNRRLRLKAFLDHYIGVYPESNDQLELILGFAKRAGFAAGMVDDSSLHVNLGRFMRLLMVVFSWLKS